MRESAPAPDTHFGFRTVPLDAKQRLVDDVFHKVARRYDVMNDLMSGGLHRAWKDALVTAVNPPTRDAPFAHIDVAGGTGDVAFRVVAAGGTQTRATVIDHNADMLAVGRARAAERGLDDAVAFVAGNAEALPAGDRSADAVSIAFGRARRALRALLIQPDPGARSRGGRRRRAVSLSGRIDSPLSETGGLRRHAASSRLPPCRVSTNVRRHRGAAFRLAPVMPASKLAP